jgi:lysophospholipase L1-like esterase
MNVAYTSLLLGLVGTGMVCADDYTLLSSIGMNEGVKIAYAGISAPRQAHIDGTAAGIEFTTESIDPRVTMSHAPISAAQWKSLHVRFQKKPTRRGEKLEFHFITKEDRKWTEDKSLALPIPEYPGPVDLFFDLREAPDFKGDVIGTRIDVGQVAGADVILMEVGYSSEPVPEVLTGAEGPILDKIQKMQNDPSWSGTQGEAIVLNSEYLVPMGSMKPVILPVGPVEKQGERLSFDVLWSARGAPRLTSGGWESALWWARDIENIKFRYRTVQVQGTPRMIIRLYEREAGVGLNNDSWQIAVPLATAQEPGEWRELTLSPETMHFIPAGSGAPQWGLVNYMTVMFMGSGGDGVEVEIESPELNFAASRSLALWDPERRLAQFEVEEAGLPIPDGRGRFLIGKGGSLVGGEEGRKTLLDLKRLIPNLGLAANQGARYLSEQASWLRENDIAVVYQQGGAYGLSEIISEANGWLENPSGVSRSTLPGAFGMVGLMKYYDMTTPEIADGFSDAFSMLAEGGIQEFQIIESYWPWIGGFWGGGVETCDRLQDALNDADDGIQWKSPSADTAVRMGFWDYFRWNNGFVMTPKDIGLESWGQFAPPPLRGVSLARSPLELKHYFLMMNLTRYESLKFFGTLGREATGAGVRFGTIINRENYDNSFDLLGLMAQPGVRVVGHEYFGNPSHYLEQAFEHGRVLRALARASETEVRGVVESNATGTSGRPYYDPQIAYAAAVASWAAEAPASVENDWLSWYMDDLKAVGNASASGRPSSQVERERYADFILKSFAFRDVLAGGWELPDPRSSFAVARSRRINDVLPEKCPLLTLLREGNWQRMRFDLTEARYLGNAFESGSVLVGEWSSYGAQDIEWLNDWLQTQDGRTLLLSGWRPGKVADGANFSALNEPAYRQINSQRGYRTFIGGTVEKASVTVSGNVDSPWLGRDVAQALGRVRLPDYYRVGDTDDALVALVSIDGQPVVSARSLSNGSRVLYLHYDSDASTAELDRAILERVAAEADIRQPLEASGLLAQTFKGPKGVLVAGFNRAWMDAFHFVYDPLAGLRMEWGWKGEPATTTLDLEEVGLGAQGKLYVVDILNGVQRELESPGSGKVELSMDGVGCALWLVTDKADVAREALESARALQPYFDYDESVFLRDDGDYAAAVPASGEPCTVVSKGMPGYSVARLDEAWSGMKGSTDGVDVVVLLAGTNDMINSHYLTPYDTFAHEYEKLIENVSADCPYIVLVTLPPCIEDCLYTRHERTAYDEAPNLRIEKANEVIAQLAAAHGLPLVDWHTLMLAPGGDASLETLLQTRTSANNPDGVHPSKDGAELLARAVAQTLVENGFNGGTVLCFGDSITYGSGLRGAGTTDGDTYPSVLRRELLK